MRRKDREQSAEFALALMEKCEYAVLATVGLDGAPYCIPISPVVHEGYIYFHCALQGEKLDNISHDKRVCISCVGHTRLVPEKFSTEYESAVAKGFCEPVTGENEKLEALRALCLKYAECNMDSFDKAAAASLARTGIYRITIESITGKAN